VDVHFVIVSTEFWCMLSKYPFPILRRPREMVFPSDTAWLAHCASILLNQGYGFEEIGELLCVSPEMLRKHYAHHDVSRKKAIVTSMKSVKIEHSGNIRKLDCRPNVAPEGSEG